MIRDYCMSSLHAYGSIILLSSFNHSLLFTAAIHCGKYATTTCKSHHSLIVTLKILPQLKKYFSSVGFGLESRQWGHSHDGVSFMVIDSQIILDTNIGLKRKSGSLEYNMLKKSEREMSDDKKRVVRGFD